MARVVLDVITLLTAGFMVGNELTVACFLHPTLARLADNIHAEAAIAFARLFGRVMPPWYAAVAVLSLVQVWVRRPQSTAAAQCLLVSILLWLAAIVYTLILPAPLNRRISRWDVQALPSNWRAERRRWDRFHWIRMGILLPALVCLIVGVALP